MHVFLSTSTLSSAAHTLTLRNATVVSHTLKSLRHRHHRALLLYSGCDFSAGCNRPIHGAVSDYSLQ
ncbi:hypothetical protein J6590_009166 [Homalodisca vitripennis]|nr:hypothetical protein J6590_009166 [Homalodisca vitripennis]